MRVTSGTYRGNDRVPIEDEEQSGGGEAGMSEEAKRLAGIVGKLKKARQEYARVEPDIESRLLGFKDSAYPS